MTFLGKTHNQFSTDKPIKAFDLLGNFKTTIINKKLFVSHFTISHLFQINPIVVADTLDRFAREDGQKDTVEKVGFMRYADAVAFRALAAECRWSGVLVEAVEAALSVEVAV